MLEIQYISYTNMYKQVPLKKHLCKLLHFQHFHARYLLHGVQECFFMSRFMTFCMFSVTLEPLFTLSILEHLK